MSKAHIAAELRKLVTLAARHRCGYCLSSEAIVGAPMEIDHLFPESRGGPTEEDNLWLACPVCNGYKSDRILAVDPQTGEMVRLFNPRQQDWTSHFCWQDGGEKILGLTAIGRSTVVALHLNRQILVNARKIWIAAGLHPPKD